jgi:HK97 family phage portal protein
VASLRELRNAPSSERLGFSEYVQWVSSSGAAFPTYGSGSSQGASESASTSFEHFAQLRATNGVVYACMAVRQRVFSEVSFRFANLNNGKLGRLFGTPALSLLEKPWPNGTTGELAARMIQDVDLAGNFFAVERAGRLYRRDPSKMSIVLTGDPKEVEFPDVVGYVYKPNGLNGPTFTYLPHEVCHWSPDPDPLESYKGQSWLRAVLREVGADNAATDHKAKFFENGATPNMVVKFPESIMTPQQFEEFKAKMDANYAGSTKAYKTLYLAPGADVQVVGNHFEQLDFANTQGRDETRIASAAGVPPIVVGLKESLAGSSLNAGNFSAARRSFADGTMRPLYRSAAAALETLVPAPQDRGASRLWYDDSQVAFFREDRGDAATIQQTQASTIASYIQAGFDPASVIAAVEAEDRSLLKHTGLFSVQLQPAGSQAAVPKRAVEHLEASRSVDAEGHTTVNVTVPTTIAVPTREEQPAQVTVVNNVQPTPVEVHAPVTVQPAATPVTVNVEPTPVTVENRNEVYPAPVSVLPSEPKSRRVIRDSKGEIVKVVEE